LLNSLFIITYSNFSIFCIQITSKDK
jgi:hypothetical protein